MSHALDRVRRFDELLSTQQVADRLGLTCRAVQSLDATLRPMRMGPQRARFYEPSSIERYAAHRDATRNR